MSERQEPSSESAVDTLMGWFADADPKTAFELSGGFEDQMQRAKETKLRSPRRSFSVQHYNSHRVPDPDHSTTIMILEDNQAPAGIDQVSRRLLSLDGDDELDRLIVALIQARTSDRDAPPLENDSGMEIP
jgi:hypothetical protein